MKIKINKSTLKDAIATVPIAGRSILPILNNVLLRAAGGEVIVAGSDLEGYGTCRALCDVMEEGSITLPASRLSKVASAAPGDTIAISTSGDKATISSGNYRTTLYGLPEGDMPKVPSLGDADTHALPGLCAMLSRAMRFWSEDATRHILNGVLIEICEGGYRAITSDGKALFRGGADGDDVARQFIMPRRMVENIVRNAAAMGDPPIEIDLPQDDRDLVRVRIGYGYSIIGMTIAGNFPNWRAIIPEIGDMHQVNTKGLAAAAHRASLIDNAVVLDARGGSMEVRSAMRDIGECVEQVDVPEGFGGRIKLSTAYLHDVLACADEEVGVWFGAMVTAWDMGDGRMAVVMGMREI